MIDRFLRFDIHDDAGLYPARTLATAFLALCSALAGMHHPASQADDAIDFTRDVRPILSNACFHCHGPDENTREADLRLDTKSGLFDDRGDYRAVAPGDVDASALIARILSDDPDVAMPPSTSKKTLTDEQRQTLVRWVEQGAPWEQHWAFVSPSKSDLPPVTNEAWCRNEIDRFVLARIEAAGLHPSHEADPYTLVRRLYLDLIGLPPTPDEADDWVRRLRQDNEAEYQQLVSHLLDSPHYGERWARRWLDLARYADSNGYEKDRDRSIWPYRDWVINAINANMPFDHFTIEQLAGDMISNASASQRVATGFHRNTMLNEEGGIDPMEFRYHAMTDRVATTGTTWLGLTLGCCQCHTHKYDPVSHTEYYQLMALLNNADEPQLDLPVDDFQQTWDRNRRQAAELLADLPNKWPEDSDSAIDEAFEKWLTAEVANAVEWTNLKPVEATSDLPILTLQDDDSIFASGDTAKRDDYFIMLAASDKPITALRLEALPDDRLPAHGPGTTYYEGTRGDFYLTEIEATAATYDGSPNPSQLLANDAAGSESRRTDAAANEAATFPFVSATQSYAKNTFGNNPVTADLSIDGDVQTGWSVHGRQGERHVAVFVFEKPVPAGQPLQIHMTFGRHFASSLGRFRFSGTNATKTPEARDHSDDVHRLLVKLGQDASAALSSTERQLLFERFLLTTPQLAEHAEQIRKLQKQPESPSSLVLRERPPQHPRPTRRHHRGEYLQPKELVQPGLPAVLSDHAAASDRLEFARWLVSDANPLTARVIVNRQWATLFGTGLVKTVGDFGFQGEPPSHPELLDWLAVTFRNDDAWSLKQLHRRMVSSATYRQASVVQPESLAVDPQNRLLSYSPRYRLDAEIIRDRLLVSAGVFSNKQGGPPVRPLQPTGVTEVAYGGPKWTASDGEDRYRRSIYTFVKRTAPFAMYSTFDAPSGEACIAQRDRSNSPLQALTLLNDVMLMDLARHAGESFASTGNDDRATLEALFRSVLIRPPADEELAMLQEFLNDQRQQFEQHPQLAAKLLELSEDHTEPADIVARQAAWAATARAVFGLDETLTRE